MTLGYKPHTTSWQLLAPVIAPHASAGILGRCYRLPDWGKFEAAAPLSTRDLSNPANNFENLRLWLRLANDDPAKTESQISSK